MLKGGTLRKMIKKCQKRQKKHAKIAPKNGGAKTRESDAQNQNTVSACGSEYFLMCVPVRGLMFCVYLLKTYLAQAKWVPNFIHVHD